MSGVGPKTAVAAAYSEGQSTMKAQVFRNSVDSCRIVHRELITSVTGSAAFAVASTIAMNPGISASFPWLSIEAQGWEKYRFRRLRFCAYTRTGSTTPGSLLMVPDYDAADSAPVNESIASSYFGTVEDVPWKDLCLEIDPKRLATDRFIRLGSLAANLDIKTYDVGNLFVCTTDGSAVNWSKLWVEYDVELINPQLPSSGSVGSGTLNAAGGSLAQATPFGAAPVAAGSYGLSAAGTNVLSISGLTVGAEYSFSGFLTGTTVSADSWSANSGLTQVSAKNPINSGQTSAAWQYTYTANSATATLTSSFTAASVTACSVVFAQMPSGSGF